MMVDQLCIPTAVTAAIASIGGIWTPIIGGRDGLNCCEG